MLPPQGHRLHQQRLPLPLLHHLPQALVLSSVPRRPAQPALMFLPPLHLQHHQHPPPYTPGSVTRTTVPHQVNPTTSSSQTISVAATDLVPGIHVSATPFRTPTPMVQPLLQFLKFLETFKLHLTQKSFSSPAQIVEVPAATSVMVHQHTMVSTLPVTQSSYLSSRCLMMETLVSMEICLRFGC